MLGSSALIGILVTDTLLPYRVLFVSSTVSGSLLVSRRKTPPVTETWIYWWANSKKSPIALIQHMCMAEMVGFEL